MGASMRTIGSQDTRCSACGAETDLRDAYCTECGADQRAGVVSGPARGRDAVEREPEWQRSEERVLPPPLSPALVAASSRSSRAKRSWQGPIASLLGLLLFASALTAFLWQRQAWKDQRSGRQLAQSSLAATQLRLKSKEAANALLTHKLTVAQTDLENAQELAKRRRGVLLRTNLVLRRVDPLLSSVDELQQLTSKIQSERDSFASSSGYLVDQLIDIGNYLLQTDPFYIDGFYVEEQIAAINSQLDAVRSASYSLSGYDDSYGGASDRFGLRANAYTEAVRRLQKQLKTAIKPG